MAGMGLLLAAGQTSHRAWASAQAENDKVKTMTLGEMKMTWIQDNAADRKMQNSLFQGADKAVIEQLSPDGGAAATVSCFLLETGGKRVLFDTANGRADSLLLPGLASIGVKPEDIDYIYITHFHGDHIGGMMRDGKPVFPRAEVYVAKAEYDGWMAMPAERKGQVVSTMEAYSSRLHQFNFGDELPGGVVAMEAVGHTPGHTVFKAGQFLVIGDLIHGAAIQLKHPEVCASFDMDQPKAVAARKKYLKYAQEEGLTMAGMHLPAPAFLKLTMEN